MAETDGFFFLIEKGIGAVICDLQGDETDGVGPHINDGYFFHWYTSLCLSLWNEKRYKKTVC